MIKIDRDVRRLSDMGIFVKKNIWVVDKKLLEYLGRYYDENPQPKLSLFERLYKWFKTKLEK